MATALKDYLFHRPVGTKFKVADDVTNFRLHIVGEPVVETQPLLPGDMFYIWSKIENKNGPVNIRLMGTNENIPLNYWMYMDDFCAHYNQRHISIIDSYTSEFVTNMKRGAEFMFDVSSARVCRYVDPDEYIIPQKGDIYVFEEIDDHRHLIMKPRGNENPDSKIKISEHKFLFYMNNGAILGVVTVSKEDLKTPEPLPRFPTEKKEVKEVTEPKKVDGEEHFRIGELYEAKDLNTDTWVVGMLLNWYDCETHGGYILNLLCDDGTTEQIDTTNADIYVATDYNVNHFCRNLRRHELKLNEQLRLIHQGITMAQNHPNYNPIVEKNSTEFKPNAGPIVIHVQGGKQKGVSGVEYVGWISENAADHTTRVMLPFFEGASFDSQLSWCGLEMRTVFKEDGTKLQVIDDTTTHGSVFDHQPSFIHCSNNTLAVVQKKMNDICDLDHSMPPDVRQIMLVNDDYEGWPDSVDKKLTSFQTDKKVWEWMGWKNNIKPMYAIAAKIPGAKEGEPDKWVFIGNHFGTYTVIVMADSLEIRLADVRAAAGFQYLLCDSEPLYMDSALGENESVFVGTVAINALSIFNRQISRVQFDMVKLIPTDFID